MHSRLPICTNLLASTERVRDTCATPSISAHPTIPRGAHRASHLVLSRDTTRVPSRVSRTCLCDTRRQSRCLLVPSKSKPDRPPKRPLPALRRVAAARRVSFLPQRSRRGGVRAFASRRFIPRRERSRPQRAGADQRSAPARTGGAENATRSSGARQKRSRRSRSRGASAAPARSRARREGVPRPSETGGAWHLADMRGARASGRAMCGDARAERHGWQQRRARAETTRGNPPRGKGPERLDHRCRHAYGLRRAHRRAPRLCVPP